MRPSVGVKAVHDSDLERILKNLGIFDAIVAARVACAVCGRQVTLNNLGTVFPKEGAVHVSCDSPHCVRAVTISSGQQRTAFTAL